MLASLPASAQTTLTAGDLAFTSFNTDAPDEWSFVVLRDIEAGTVISFTTLGWNGTGFYAQNEETLVLTTSALPEGTQVQVQGSTFTIIGGGSAGSATGEAFTMLGGDSILAYQGLESSPTFIAGILGDYNSSDFDPATNWNTGTSLNVTSSALPAGLTNGLTAVALYVGPGFELDNSRYTCAVTTGSRTEVLSAINDRTNWEGSDTILYSPNCTFTPPLPVELVSFSVLADGADALLQWETASETNNAGFDVERLQRGTWQALGFVEGYGTTAEAQRYAYRAEGLAPGTHVFRLRQVDFDGAFAYSPEVEVTLEAADLSLAVTGTRAGLLEGTVSVPNSQRARVTVFDVLGRQVAAQEVTSGRFAFETPLAPGVYVLRVEAGAQMLTRSAVVAR